MRLGVLSQWFAPEPTLMPSVLAAELSNRGHDVRVLTGFPNYPTGRIYEGYRVQLKSDEGSDGIAIRRVAMYASHGESRLGRVGNYVTFAVSASIFSPGWFKDAEGIWVANSPPTVGLPTWITKFRRHSRIVLHILDPWPESLLASRLGGPMVRSRAALAALDRWLAMTYRTADSIACTSRRQMEVLAERGVPTEKLSYVPIWVDETIFHPSPRDEGLANSLGVGDKTVLLYAGAIGEPQGLEILVDVCARLRDLADFHCVVAGTGIAEKRLRDRATELGLRNITFLGPWPSAEMTRLMSIGDIHFASLRDDPITEVAMPSKVPATMACAKPIVVSAAGETAAVVSKSGSGWTCAPGDVNQLEVALRQAVALGKHALEAMGIAARKAYENEFAAEIGVGRIERLLAGARA